MIKETKPIFDPTICIRKSVDSTDLSITDDDRNLISFKEEVSIDNNIVTYEDVTVISAEVEEDLFDEGDENE